MKMKTKPDLISMKTELSNLKAEMKKIRKEVKKLRRVIEADEKNLRKDEEELRKTEAYLDGVFTGKTVIFGAISTKEGMGELADALKEVDGYLSKACGKDKTPFYNQLFKNLSEKLKNDSKGIREELSEEEIDGLAERLSALSAIYFIPISPEEVKKQLLNPNIKLSKIEGKIKKYSELHKRVSTLSAKVGEEREKLRRMGEKLKKMEEEYGKISTMIKEEKRRLNNEERMREIKEELLKVEDARRTYEEKREELFSTLRLISEYKELSDKRRELQKKLDVNLEEDKCRRRIEALMVKRKRGEELSIKDQRAWAEATAYLSMRNAEKERIRKELSLVEGRIEELKQEIIALNPEIGFVDMGSLSKLEKNIHEIIEIAENYEETIAELKEKLRELGE